MSQQIKYGENSLEEEYGLPETHEYMEYNSGSIGQQIMINDSKEFNSIEREEDKKTEEGEEVFAGDSPV